MRREKGFGCLVSKGRGKPFLARWVHRGKVYTKSTHETDRRRALRELERLTRPFREESELGVLRAMEARIKAAEAQTAAPKTTLAEMFAKFEALPQTRDLAEGTRRKYAREWSLMAKWMKARGKSDADAVREADAEAYLGELAGKCGPDAYNMRLILFKRMWREFGGGPGPFEKFPKRKAAKASGRRALTEEEAERVMAEAAKDPDDELLFSLGVYAGLRVSDCAMMKAESVDLAANLLRVVPIKTKRHMTAPIEIPMHPALRKVVERAVAARPSGYLSERNAATYESGSLADRTKALFERVGIKTCEVVDGRMKFLCGFHSLRHTFVSMSINNGVSPMLVQHIVGHSAVDMTEAYFHAERDAVKKGIETLPDFVA